MTGAASDWLERVGSSLTALTVMAGALAWLVGPRVRAFVRDQASTARAVQGAPGQPSVPDQLAELDRVLREHIAQAAPSLRKLDQLAVDVHALTASVADLTARQDRQDAETRRLARQVDELDGRVAAYLAEAAAELRLARAARLLREGPGAWSGSGYTTPYPGLVDATGQPPHRDDPGPAC